MVEKLTYKKQHLLLLFFMLFLTGSTCWATTSQEQKNLKARLEQGQEIRIVTLGTSLTGGKWRWPEVMMEWLNEDYPGQVNMINMGVGASASMTVPAMEGNAYIWKKCGLDLLPKAITLQPDVVFIEFAVNDAY